MGFRGLLNFLRGLANGYVMAGALFSLMFYVILMGLPQSYLGQKMRLEQNRMAFIPGANVYHLHAMTRIDTFFMRIALGGLGTTLVAFILAALCRMAGLNILGRLFVVVAVMALLVFYVGLVRIYMGLMERMYQHEWLGILCIIPLLGILIMTYFAVTYEEQPDIQELM